MSCRSAGSRRSSTRPDAERSTRRAEVDAPIVDLFAGGAGTDTWGVGLEDVVSGCEVPVLRRQQIVHPVDTGESSARRSVVVVGHEYRIFRSDQSAARAEARTLAARRFDVELEEVLVVGAVPIEEDDGPLGWLVSVRLG